MTFAYHVKSELCETAFRNQCCKKAALYGILIFGRLFSHSGFIMQTENDEVLHTTYDLLLGLYHIKPKVKSVIRTDGRRFEHLTVEDKSDAGRLFEAFGHSEKNLTLRFNRANIENDCCSAAFLRGVFLVCGSVVNPGKDYHLEFVCPHMKLGRDLADFMEELGLEPKTIVRKGNFVIYFKDSGQIEDVLTFMGAVKSSLELMNIKVYKDFRNKANRVTNCETANIGKTVDAASQQIEAIKKVLSKKGSELIPEELREIAKLRLENSDATLRELAEIAKISRSGVNHRLRRIMEIAQKLK